MRRREFLRLAAAAGIAPAAVSLMGGCHKAGPVEPKRWVEMSVQEKREWIEKLKGEAERRSGKEWRIGGEEAQPGVKFGYGLDISRCIGCRRCVYACVEENNQSRRPQLHWISVLEMEKERGIDFAHANIYYQRETVPAPGHFYLPVSCQQCDNPPCVKVCPVKATWKEPDGIVVVDYNWCIGCRYCMAACPYGARHFNWGEPQVDHWNTTAHVLGNRPRYAGVVEKCTFCIQRVRQGRYPACVEVCPVGARKFGNLLDPESEIRFIIENKRVLRLKEDLNTQPSFFYFYAT
jgi:Fe-S-cluster-containing dehydrogenase component